jgi:hypothetical protein
MRRNLLLVTVCAGLLVQGCSSRPREFNPTLAAASADRTAFDAAYAECNQLLVTGKLDANGRSSSLGGGAAAGATTAAVGMGTAATIGGYGGLAAASATVILLPFAIVGGAWGMAKMKRAKKEKAIKTAMTGCLHDRGYAVASWEIAKKKRGAATTAAAN